MSLGITTSQSGRGNNRKKRSGSLHVGKKNEKVACKSVACLPYQFRTLISPPPHPFFFLARRSISCTFYSLASHIEVVSTPTSFGAAVSGRDDQLLLDPRADKVKNRACFFA